MDVLLQNDSTSLAWCSHRAHWLFNHYTRFVNDFNNTIIYSSIQLKRQNTERRKCPYLNSPLLQPWRTECTQACELHLTKPFNVICRFEMLIIWRGDLSPRYQLSHVGFISGWVFAMLSWRWRYLVICWSVLEQDFWIIIYFKACSESLAAHRSEQEALIVE